MTVSCEPQCHLGDMSVFACDCRHTLVSAITHFTYMIEIAYFHQTVHLCGALIRLWSRVVLQFACWCAQTVNLWLLKLLVSNRETSSRWLKIFLMNLFNVSCWCYLIIFATLKKYFTLSSHTIPFDVNSLDRCHHRCLISNLLLANHLHMRGDAHLLLVLWNFSTQSQNKAAHRLERTFWSTIWLFFPVRFTADQNSTWMEIICIPSSSSFD